ncbi:hypothetical protein BX666DRAFT_762203 [Dichotomocladium elegans]|nr:hypothetical protein BX666DRAFT_762203 [Dichotomocladium elegans]
MEEMGSGLAFRTQIVVFTVTTLQMKIADDLNHALPVVSHVAYFVAVSCNILHFAVVTDNVWVVDWIALVLDRTWILLLFVLLRMESAVHVELKRMIGVTVVLADIASCT